MLRDHANNDGKDRIAYPNATVKALEVEKKRSDP